MYTFFPFQASFTPVKWKQYRYVTRYCDKKKQKQTKLKLQAAFSGVQAVKGVVHFKGPMCRPTYDRLFYHES